jgi:hypothetical protein
VALFMAMPFGIMMPRWTRRECLEPEWVLEVELMCQSRPTAQGHPTPSGAGIL